MKYIQRCKRACEVPAEKLPRPLRSVVFRFRAGQRCQHSSKISWVRARFARSNSVETEEPGKFYDRRTATQDRMLKPLLTKTSGSSAFSRFCRFGPNAEREGELQGFPVPENGQMHHSPRFQTADHAGYVARGFDIIFVNRQNHILLF